MQLVWNFTILQLDVRRKNDTFINIQFTFNVSQGLLLPASVVGNVHIFHFYGGKCKQQYNKWFTVNKAVYFGNV